MRVYGHVVWAVAAAASILFVGDAKAQQPTLPAEVSEWLERDQARRWATMI